MRKVVRMCLTTTFVACLGVLCQSGLAAESPQPAEVKSPLSPEESLAAFVVDPAVSVQLVAAEPEVIDPVAVHFGADGSLWVVEMRDYPHGPANGQPGKSQIKRLRDTDGDGRFETANTFADELLFVTGVLPYRDGLIVTLAGKVMFFADRDNDGQAEFRETWFSGFAEQNSQLRANHPTFGPDGYIYIANGLRGGKVVAEKPEWKRDKEPLTITGFDFCFHPETGDFRAVNGQGQFGLTFDDYGRRFVCSNRNPCIQVMLSDRYLSQNPLFGVRQVVHDVCRAGENSRLFPISKAWTTSTLHANQFTAACGVIIYRGDGLPAEFYGNAFTCDPTGNLVHREVLTPDGATFSGKSPYEQREFLASPDTWFRPVNLAHGPDGALYIVDMYRAVIEHPDFMPTELKTRPDLLLGTDRGRIYRVLAKSPQSRGVASTPASTGKELLAQLNHPNSFQRETAFRKLVEERPAGVSLEELKKQCSNGLPYARVAALRLLDQYDLLPMDLLLESLGDDSPEVRETALILAEGVSNHLPVREKMLELVTDEQPRVRFQAVQSLTMGPADNALLQALTSLALREQADVWTRAAIITAARGQSAVLLTSLLKAAAQDEATATKVIELCSELAPVVAQPAFDQSREPVWTTLLAGDGAALSPAQREFRWSVLETLATATQRRGKTMQTSAGFPKSATPRLQAILNAAVDSASASDLAVKARLAAIGIARFADAEKAAPALLTIALDSPEVEIQQAAFASLATFSSASLADPLLARFAEASPTARRGILDVLLSSEARTKRLIESLESGDIKSTELDPLRVQRLTNLRNAELRERAKKVFAAATAERGAVLAEYQPVLKMDADPRRGRAIFEKQCVTCHRVGDIGVNVGPDIADSRTKTPDVLLTAILDPNRAIDNNFFGYTIATVEGKVLTGIITSETSSSITLRQPEGKMETILRSDIEVMKNTGMSLMPVGFEKNIPPQQMADLISFLKNWRYLDGSVPLSDRK